METLALVCSSCGEERRRAPKLCGAARLCLRCRRKRAEIYQRRFAEARAPALRAARAAGLMRRGAPGGAWGERFVTLTVPHSGDPAEDAREATRAWARLLRRLRDHWREVLEEDTSEGHARWLVREHVRYLRALEATPGTDDRGHAHLHIYLLSPYVAQPVLAHLWARSLSAPYRERAPEVDVAELLEATPGGERQRERVRRVLRTRRGRHGRALVRARRPVVDVRRCRHRVERELVKYLVKDAQWVHGTLVHADPDAFGRLYAALDGRRTVVASRGWLRRHRLEACPCCDGEHVHIVTDAESASPEARAARRLADLARRAEFEGARFHGNTRDALGEFASLL